MSLCSYLICLMAMFNASKGEGEGILLELCSLVSLELQDRELTIPESIVQLLQVYIDVFEEPKALPLV